MFIGVYLIYNTVLVSGVQQSESVIHMSTFFFSILSHIAQYRGHFLFLQINFRMSFLNFITYKIDTLIGFLLHL